MAPVVKKASLPKTVHHFTHKHLLLETFEDKEFICNGCNTFGSGLRYQCNKCTFDLHEDCATCPMSLSSHIHPKHQLVLVQQAVGMMRPGHGHGRPRPCDVCSEPVQGLFYSCPSCNFVIHPLCFKFPSHVQHVIDRKHSLTFQSASPRWCTICRGICTSWRYRCGPCGIDIHLDCVVAPYRGSHSPHAPLMQSQPPCVNYAIGMPSSSTYGVHKSINHAPQGSGAPSGSKRRKMYAIVGRIAATLVVSAVLGVPAISPF